MEPGERSPEYNAFRKTAEQAFCAEAVPAVKADFEIGGKEIEDFAKTEDLERVVLRLSDQDNQTLSLKNLTGVLHAGRESLLAHCQVR